MAVCANCGQEINEPTTISVSERIPCPNCGSTSRAQHRSTQSNIAYGERVVLHKDGADGSQAIRVTDRRTRSSTVDLERDGTLTYSIHGTSPQGEEGVLETCIILAQRLNMNGGQWGPPIIPSGPEGGVDCILRDQREEIHVQVTRVVPSEYFWRQLRQTESVSEVATVQSAADDLLSRARTKAYGIPTSQLANVVLAIDVRDTAGHSLHTVIDDFRQRHGSVLTTLGFRAVWIVGPTVHLTEQLDH